MDKSSDGKSTQDSQKTLLRTIISSVSCVDHNIDTQESGDHSSSIGGGDCKIYSNDDNHSSTNTATTTNTTATATTTTTKDYEDARHCTSLPLCYDRSELFTLGSRPGMECMPLRSPPGPYHYHVTDQTKSLQELQNEVGALLEFRDLVIETFPDLKHKMASISASNTITGIPSSSLASRRDWEPGIRVRRKLTQKDQQQQHQQHVDLAASSSLLIRSRSNSHSGKKEPKSGEGNGSVVQDSGFSTETSSSKETHSASSTTGGNGANGSNINNNNNNNNNSSSGNSGGVANNAGGNHQHPLHHKNNQSNHLPATSQICHQNLTDNTEDELWNLLDVIHRKSTRLRDEVEQLQNFEKNKFNNSDSTQLTVEVVTKLTANSNNNLGTMFNDHLHRINKDDIQILRKERDQLLDKLCDMEAETLASRRKTNQMTDEVDALQMIKCDLEEQLKVALSQKMELNSRIIERFGATVGTSASSNKLRLPVSTIATSSSSPSSSPIDKSTALNDVKTIIGMGGQTFSPVILTSSSSSSSSSSSTTTTTTTAATGAINVVATTVGVPLHSQLTTITPKNDFVLGRLDGLVSSPNRCSRVRVTDSKKIAAILLETNIIELQRHLLTITVQNQVLTQRLEQATKSKIFLIKKLDKAKEDIEDLRFQLEEKNIDLEGTRAQLRIIETKSINNINNNYSSNQKNQQQKPNKSDHIENHDHLHNYSPEPPHHLHQYNSRTSSTMIMPASQVSTPSMKAMIPLAMDELHHHNNSSTESAQDQTELENGNSNLLNSGSGIGGNGNNNNNNFNGGRQDTPRKRPSKIPLPGTKGYLAPKPPTGRNVIPQSASSSTIQRVSPSGPSSNRSLSKSTGSLFGVGRSSIIGNGGGGSGGGGGPNSVTRKDQLSSTITTSSNIYRPESAQSLRKDLTSITSSRSSLIPMSGGGGGGIGGGSIKNSPTSRTINVSPVPKTKRESLTSRARNLDSLTRVQTPSSSQSDGTISGNNINNSSGGYSNSSNILYKSPSKKDLSSSFSTGQNRKQGVTSVRRVSSASVGRGGGGGGGGGGSGNGNNLSGGLDISSSSSGGVGSNNGELDNGKKIQPNEIRRMSTSSINLNMLTTLTGTTASSSITKVKLTKSPSTSSIKLCEQSQTCLSAPTTAIKKSTPLIPSRDLIREYLARTFPPPPIFKPSFQPFSPPPQLELAYKHPRLLLADDDDDSNNNNNINSTNNSNNNSNNNNNDIKDDETELPTEMNDRMYNKINRDEIKIKYIDDSSIKLMDLPPPSDGTSNKLKKYNTKEKRSAFLSNNFVVDTQQQQQQQQQQQKQQQHETCTLIGKVNPNLIKTWEQLNNQKALYPVNHVIHSESSEDFYDSIDDQFISELQRIPSMCHDQDDDDDDDDDYDNLDLDCADQEDLQSHSIRSERIGLTSSSGGGYVSGYKRTQRRRSTTNKSIQRSVNVTAGEVMANFESFDKRKSCWSIESGSTAGGGVGNSGDVVSRNGSDHLVI